MKKNLIAIATAVALISLIFLIWVGVFWWNNLRGVGPALRQPADDIAVIIEQRERDILNLDRPELITATETNTTGFPLTLADGFSISIFAKGLQNARVMTRDPEGNLLVSLTKSDKIVALPDRDGDGKADEIITVAENLNRPHGMVFQCTDRCRLYIAESHQISAFDYDQANLKAFNQTPLVDLPDDGRHFTRTLLFRTERPEENRLMVSIGSSCDTCIEKDQRRAAIWQLDLNDNSFTPFAKGLRNSVFMALHPGTGHLWATDMGRDLLGDDLPPDEVNIVEENKNYGWPFCYGDNVHDQVFDTKDVQTIRAPCSEPFEVPSHIDLPAHSSPLGLAFFPTEGWPEEFHGDLLIAYHGSWNRTVPTGYKLVRYHLDRLGNVVAFEDFMTGLLRPNKTSLGRPVDIRIEPNGVIYVTDDKAGVVYRLLYTDPFPDRPSKPVSDCVISGCSGEICAEEERFSTCVFKPEYSCYKEAICERQAGGQCGWTQTEALKKCIDEKSQNPTSLEKVF